jgi:hypothetical protein
MARLTRLGFAVRGLLYGAIGLLAIEVALGVRSAPEDVTGVLGLIGRQSFGRPLLVVIAVGLAALAMYGFSRIVYDPFEHETSTPRPLQRVGFFVSGLAYTALVFTALRVLSGLRRLADGVPSPEQAASGLLTTPWGPWLVGLAGLVVLIVGGVELWRAIGYDFGKDLKRYELSPVQTRWACNIGRCGTAARGLVIALVGLFLIQAALFASPQDVKGMDEALLALARQPYGPWLLALVALGLMMFGGYSLLGAVWFRVRQADGPGRA